MHRFGLHDWGRRPRGRFFPKIRRRRREGRRLWLENLEPRQLLVGEIEFTTELTSLDLTGGPFPMPLASDPGNALGDSIDGFGFVDSQVSITLSSQRATNPGPASLGQAFAFPFGGAATAGPQPQNIGGIEPINPEELDGEPFIVDSFFDVFFDITITDVDPRPGRDFATGTPTISILDVGPANMQSFAGQREPLLFDKDAPNFGLVPPPEADPYIGHFDIVIDLSTVFGQTVDINQNGDPDLLKFTLATHSAGDENRQFIQLPDGSTLDEFDSAAFLDGAILDSMDDPPFQIGRIDPQTGLPDPAVFGGPTTATSTLLNPIIEVDVFPRTIGQVVIESPPPAGAITPNPELPPEDGEYRTAADIHAEFQGPALTVVLQDIRHRAVAGTTVRTPIGPDELEEFVSTLQGTAIIDGQAFPVELTGPVQVLTLGKVGNTTGTFQTEIISMTLTGQIPGGPTIEIRESPGQQSLGQTTITDLGTGNFQIDSFFDVFTELSIDGDPFIPSTDAAQVNLVQPGIRTPNPELPPTDGAYRTAADVHAEFQGPDLEIVLQDIRHRPFADRIVRTPIGPDELEQFNSSLTGTAVVTSAGLGLDGVLIPVELTGPVETIVFGKVGNTTGTFQTEIISMSLSGDLPLPSGGTVAIVIQESPTLATLGEVRIQDIGGGQFQIDSFFDVFTEISVDGGLFIPSTGPAHVELAPAPILVTGAGPATVNVFFEGPVEGDANDDDLNGLDEVVTELVQADFDGFHPQLGPIQIRLRDDQPSLGQIEELVNNTPGLLDVNPFAPGQADSFFDVFFDITVVATGQVLTTAGPTRVQAVINNKPPQDGERYIFNPPQPVELLDKATGQPTGFYITKEIHDDSPTVEHDIFPRTVGQILIELPDGSTELITTAGPSQVDVYFEGGAEGDATDDDGDGLDEVVSELVQADFDGFHPLLGPVQIRLRDDFPSLGQITELVNDNPGLLDVDPFAPGAADSFFDVFFEITLPATGQTLVTAAPTRVQSVIENKPPQDGERYIFNPPQPVELIDKATGLGTGIFIVKEIHDENPTVEHDIFPRTVGQVVIELPDGSTELITTAGPSAVDVYFEGAAEGDASDDDGDGLDEVVSELVQADFDGFHPLLGPVQIRLRNDLPSLGQITELVNNNPGLLDVDPFAPGAADSFFDVFFEITLPATGQTLVTAAPTRVQSVIENKPPQDGERYIFNPPQPVELIDKATGLGTGIFIVREIHDENPTVEEDTFVQSVVELELILPDSSTETLQLTGPAKVDVYFEGAAEGDASDDDGNGLDEVVAEMVQLDLAGTSSLGPVVVRLDPNQPTLGRIEELINNNPGLLDVDPFAPGDADSFFDVFFEIEIGGQVFHGATAKRVQTIITNKPPAADDVYVGVDVIDLLDENGQPTGFAIGTVRHAPTAVDYGDAPDAAGGPATGNPYPTLLEHDGARHVIVAGAPFLGIVPPDPEVDGQPTANADGDDTDGNDDEDGLTAVAGDFSGPGQILPGESFQASVTVNGTGLLNAWVDWNRNGSWNDAGEQLAADVPFATGPGGATITFDGFAPTTAFPGDSFIRLRVSTDAGLLPTGLASDGEVEDFEITILDGVGCSLVVTHTGDSGPGSFRDAIVCANTNAGLDTIRFDIPGAGPHTITPLSPLPPITDAVVIDGTTEPDFAGTPVVELDGSSASGFRAKGLTVLAGPSTILGLVVNRWTDVGIFLGSGSDGSFVDLNYIGTDVAGTAALPNGTGIRINRSSNNTIGTGAAGNVISGNTGPGTRGAGIRISSATSTGNNIWHNLIGTDFTGTVALGNDVGVDVASAQSNNIGGSSGSQGNTISGNRDVGVKLRGDNNNVQGNRIGTNLAGTAAVPNNNNGIEIDISTGNTVGGTVANASNQISGNTNAGVLISGATGTANFVEGNLIGTDATGSGPLGNKEGIVIDGAPANTIGGTALGAGNTIAGNTKNGIFIRNAGATGNVVQGNNLGANPFAMATVPNGRGILIDDAANNQIGTAGAGNLISGNSAEGIRIQDAGSTGNTVQSNTIGLNATDSAAVPNNIGVRFLNLATGNTIGGDSTAGEGNVIAGNTLDGVYVKNANGNLVYGNIIGTNSAGAAGLGNGDDGVEIANSQNTEVGGSGTGQGNVISGNTEFGVRLLASSSSNTVRGNRIGTDPSGLAPLPNQTGVYVFGSANTIGGPNPGEGNVISGNADAGVRLDGASATGNMLFGNLVGVNATGTGAVANKYGVYVTGAASNIVGGANNGEGNTISGNTLHGVYLFGAGTTGNSVEGNQIGTNAAGTAAVANQGQGVLIDNAAGNTIGGPAPGAGNLISGNTLDGVKISGLAATGNALEGNTIGEDLGGNPIPNRNGVLIADDASGNTVGDGTAAGSNTIADNSQRGIWINGNAGTGNAISRNSIHNNGGAARLGIDLGGNGVTANDVNDPDPGANNLQNSPMIGAVLLNAGNLDVIYSVDSTTANSAYPLTVEFFVADSDFQEGERFLGDVQYTAAVAGGSAAGSIPAGPAGIGTIIVATATDADGNTSEFSAPVTVAAMLSAAGGEASPESRVEGQRLALDELLPVVDAAISRFASLGFDGDLFATVDVSIADLPGAALGAATTNSVTIDVDAAGHGWFIDPSPLDDSEFSNPHSAIRDPKSIDLLTAVMHELGHAIGLEDLHGAGAEDDLLFGLLGPGVRKTALEASLADRLFAGGVEN